MRTKIGITPPTLDEIKQWPATVEVARAAAAFGISRAHAYELARRGELPGRVLKVGSCYRVVTASILAELEGA
jgi:hypothetical protein